MPTLIPDTIKQKNNAPFPVAVSNDIKGGPFSVKTPEEMYEISDEFKIPGCFCFVENETISYRWQEEDGSYDWVPFGVMGTTVPELIYDESYPQGKRIYFKVGDNQRIICRFVSASYGNCTIMVYKDNVLYKSFSTAKGTIQVDLGVADAEGTFQYRIAAQDYLGIAAPDDLYFTVIIGGCKLSSTFDTIISQTIEDSTDINIPYNTSCADTTAKIKIRFKLTNYDTQTVIKDEVLDTNAYESNGQYNIGRLPKGTYDLYMVAYTGSSEYDDSNISVVSPPLNYRFSVLSEGELAIVSDFNSAGISTDTYVSIPFRCSAKGISRLIMRGTLYTIATDGTETIYTTTSSSGITCTVDVSSYWFIGKIPAGRYRYEIKAYTLDSQKVSDPSSSTFVVEEGSYSKIDPIKTNMIAWFDANDMRNTVDRPDIWINKADTGNIYQIKLHNLNYETNGWKHVDESLSDSDSGEMMLKFTGDSYGEMIDTSSNTNYCPLSMLTSAAEGYTLEVLFRTRCIGEMNTRVMTCQNGTDIGTPGFSVKYNDMIIASDSQNTSLGFAEEQWVHAAFVIDKNIRTLENVGLNSIEDMNPIPMMKIYINGSLCSVTALGKDKFLDSNGNAYPLYLNCAKDISGVISNFGECEIKMIRMYSSYLKSSDVLNNYISTFYDTDVQKEIYDKNDTSIASAPSITFKRNKNSSNQSTFAIMNSITDKATSKKTFVDCIVEVNYGYGNIDVWESVEVFLQGTSSLQYPVKNYKLKLYEDITKKMKLKVKMEDDWMPESTFTLKCDYMDHSHLNNTPTANLYTELIKELGGSSPSTEIGGRDAIDGFPVLVYFTDDPDDPAALTYAGSFMFNLDKSANTLGFGAEVLDSDGNPFRDHNGNIIPNKMQSFEGVANSTDTAGCFFALKDSIKSVYNYYVDDCYNEAHDKYLKDHGLSYDDMSLDEFKETPEGQAVTYMTFEEFEATYDELDYIAEDFEQRYDYTEYEDIENPTHEDKERCYGPIRDLVNWVSDTSKDHARFKSEFNDHFDYTYCLAYYLQMIVFGQADNAGKNSMWDTWDGKLWRPRPYDMDTQVGLSNTGTETINPDAEYNNVLSPTKATGTFASFTTNSVTELRYSSYNTKTSRFWNTFATVFADDIAKKYQILRKSIYNVDFLMPFFKSFTVDIIGEVYYNKDAGAKYLSQTNTNNTEWLKMLHGNRIQKFQQWIEQRLVFCDTLFAYRYSEENSDSLNGEITLRSDAYIGTSGGGNEEESTLKAYIGIATFTPGYVTVDVGSSRDAVITAYVGPNSTYVDPDTKLEMTGTLFTIPIKATDKEIAISGAGNIMYIHKLEDLNIRDLTIAQAFKILKLDLQGSSRMTKLSMGDNKYLKELNCSGSYLLGTAAGGQVLDLSKCKNIQKVNIQNTQITTINFASGGNLKEVNLSYSLIRNISFKLLEFLTTVDITGCTNISEYMVEACPNLTNISLANAPIVTFKAVDCTNLIRVDCSGCKALENFEITGCDNITSLIMTDNTGKMMEDLKLYTLYKLEELRVGNSSTLKNIRFPKYRSKEEADRIAAAKLENPSLTDEDLDAKLWDNIKTLVFSYSGIKWIQYGSDDIPEATRSMNLKQLTKLSSITFQSCTSVQYIENLNYTVANGSNLFRDCTSLVSIRGYLKVTYNAFSIFYNCTTLSDLSDLVTDFAGCTTLSSAFFGCRKMTFETVKQLLHTCNGSLTNVAGLMNYWRDQDTAIANQNKKLPDDMFDTTPNITNINSILDAVYSVTEIKSEPFKKLTKVTSANNAFARMNKLVSVDSDLLAQFPNLVSASGMFVSSTALVNFIDTDPNVFANNSKLTNTNQMFYNCPKLLNTNGWGDMFKPLVNLSSAQFMFGKCSGLTKNLPEGIFAGCTNLTDIRGIFTGCTGLTILPNRLFRENASDTNTCNRLTSAQSVFYGCTKLTGTVRSDIFAGAPNIIDIGQSTNIDQILTTTKILCYGFFGNTLVNGYYDDFLHTIPNLQNAYGLFKANDATKNALRYCYHRNSDGTEIEYQNTISINLFAKNPFLTNTSSAFSNCQSISGCIPCTDEDGNEKSFFYACKKTIQNVSSMFYNCIGLTGIDLDNATIVGIKSSLFEGCTALRYLNQFMDGCTKYTMEFPENLFKGCANIENVSYMFRNCTNLSGSIYANTFDSCRNKLANTAYMFYATGLSGELPSGTYDEDGLPIQRGLLSECINLENTSYMFYNCLELTGSIPDDIFYTSSLADKYLKLTNVSSMFMNCRGLNKANVDSVTGVKYLVSSQFFQKCVAITNISNCFNRLLGMEACQLDQTMFQRQVALVNATGLFYGTRALTGPVTSTFMANCISTLEEAYQLFGYCNMTQVDSGFLHGELKNSKLKTVGAMFYDNTNLTGSSPEFWNGNIFTAIQGSEIGYFGCLYNATKLSNYNAAKNISQNWVKNVNIWI